VDYVRRTIDDPRVKVAIAPTFKTEPSPVSPVESDAFRLLARTIREVVPSAIVVPWLVVGGTDSRYFTALTDNVYRFSGVPVGPSDPERAHGTNERVSVSGHEQNVTFYLQLIRNAAVNPPSPTGR
jgi:carboxypeptidase PM20D1